MGRHEIFTTTVRYALAVYHYARFEHENIPSFNALVPAFCRHRIKGLSRSNNIANDSEKGIQMMSGKMDTMCLSSFLVCKLRRLETELTLPHFFLYIEWRELQARSFFIHIRRINSLFPTLPQCEKTTLLAPLTHTNVM